jgi:hypothetical protein
MLGKTSEPCNPFLKYENIEAKETYCYFGEFHRAPLMEIGQCHKRKETPIDETITASTTQLTKLTKLHPLLYQGRW